MMHNSLNNQGLKDPILEPRIPQMALIKGLFIREIRVIRGKKSDEILGANEARTYFDRL